MKWVTRERPKIDRIACPWLIERFIEKQPEFLYVPADKVLATAKETGAIPYDIPGVKFSHVGEKCSFDAFIAAYNFAKHLKTLRGLTPYEHICKAWADQPRRFRYDPTHLTSGLNN